MSTLINYLEKPKGWDQNMYKLDSYEQYASIPALRSTELKKLDKSPAHYRAAIEHEKQVTPALQKSFDRGKAFDLLIIDGQEAFNDKVIIEPDMHKATKAYKSWKKHLAKGTIALSEQEYNFCLKMREQAFKKEQFSKIFDAPGHAHRAIVWQDRGTGIWCKAEIDWITADGTVVDLKSAADAGFWFFQRQARRLGYLNQGAYYMDGLSAVTGIAHTQFLLAVVEVEPPFESHVFRPTLEQLSQAQDQNEDRLNRLKECLENDSWPGYPDEIIDLDSGQYETFNDLDDLMDNGGDDYEW